ncbi:hypothetical protein [Mycolicibacterium sp. XJ870]
MVSEREAGGGFDYLWEEPAPGPEVGSDARPDTGPDAGPDGFDAFDINTWNFKPAPVPWYRTRGAAIALIAAGVAAAAIVVSVVLLLLRDAPSSVDRDEPTSVAPTAGTTPPTPSPTLRVGVPPAPPPPPPPTQEAPRSPVYRPTQRPRESKKPEIGVTRTPVTRSPISVAPEPRRPRN